MNNLLYKKNNNIKSNIQIQQKYTPSLDTMLSEVFPRLLDDNNYYLISGIATISDFLSKNNETIPVSVFLTINLTVALIIVVMAGLLQSLFFLLEPTVSTVASNISALYLKHVDLNHFCGFHCPPNNMILQQIPEEEDGDNGSSIGDDYNRSNIFLIRTMSSSTSSSPVQTDKEGNKDQLRQPNDSFVTETSVDEEEEDDTDNDDAVGAAVIVMNTNICKNSTKDLEVSPSNTSSKKKTLNGSFHTPTKSPKEVNKDNTDPITPQTEKETIRSYFNDDDHEEEEDDDFDCFYEIHCPVYSKNDDGDDDEHSDASSITKPSFRPGGRRKQGKLGHVMRGKSILTNAILAKSKVIQSLQHAFRNNILSKSRRTKDGSDHTQETSNNDAMNKNNDDDDVPSSCSCLILLMEPTTLTFEIIPVSYFPGISYVSDLLEQIPLQSTFNFRLRFQHYTGLLAFESNNHSINDLDVDDSIETIRRRHKKRNYERRNALSFASMDVNDDKITSMKYSKQLVQSRPVPIKYSCEYHQLKQEENGTTNETATMMPLVAILPETKSTDHGSMVEKTEQLARELLSDPKVIQRLQYLQKQEVNIVDESTQ